MLAARLCAACALPGRFTVPPGWDDGFALPVGPFCTFPPTMPSDEVLCRAASPGSGGMLAARLCAACALPGRFAASPCTVCAPPGLFAPKLCAACASPIAFSIAPRTGCAFPGSGGMLAVTLRAAGLPPSTIGPFAFCALPAVPPGAFCPVKGITAPPPSRSDASRVPVEVPARPYRARSRSSASTNICVCTGFSGFLSGMGGFCAVSASFLCFSASGVMSRTVTVR